MYYLRNKEKHEIDFLVLGRSAEPLLLEVKLSEDQPSRNFSRFSDYFPGAKKVQIVKELKREKTYPDNTEIRRAHTWLTKFSFQADQ